MFFVKISLLAIVSTSLGFLGVVKALAIDNQLSVIRNDCFERLAIGHRLNPKNVYKTYNYNTVAECQAACTQDKEACKAFSLGIGLKGNSTCELSHDSVKETADLKPIDTITDTDFDLYIKKLGCQLVLEKPLHQKPLEESASTSSGIGTKLGKPPENSYDHGSQEGYGGYVQENSQNQGYNQHQETHKYYGGEHRPHNLYGHGHPKPNDGSSNYDSPSSAAGHSSNIPKPMLADGYHYNPPNVNSPPHQNNKPSASEGDSVQHVQTLVSIATGPQTYLHPVHDILVGEETYSQLKPGRPSNNNDYGHLPPFRPQTMSHPYDDHRPMSRPQNLAHAEHHGNNAAYDNPPSNYDLKPQFGYENNPQSGQTRPFITYNEEPSNSHDNRPHFGSIPSFNNGDLNPHFGYEHDRPVQNGGSGSKPSDFEYRYKPNNVQSSSGVELDIDRRYSQYGSEYNRYENRRPFRPLPNLINDRFDRPLPSRYGSLIPHPNDYNKRPQSYDYLFEMDPYYDDKRPSFRPFDRPFRYDYGPSNPLDGQNYGSYKDGQNQDSYGTEESPQIGYYHPTKHDGQYDLDTNKISKNQSENHLDDFKKLTNSYNDNVNKDGRPNKGTDVGFNKEENLTKNGTNGGAYYGDSNKQKNVVGGFPVKSVVTHSVGHHGEKITSIITEIPEGNMHN